MIQFTTPTITLKVKGIDISQTDAYVTIKQNTLELTKTGADLSISTETIQGVTNTLIAFTLTQEETAAFAQDRTAKIQVNWYSNGIRLATEKKAVIFSENLLDEVIQ